MATPFFVLEPWLDIVYPSRCVGCEQEGEWVCEKCVRSISFVPSDEDIVALGYYGHPLLRYVLTRFKYVPATCLLSPLSTLVRRFRFERQRLWPWAGEERLMLCSIPSDAERVRARGIDHAILLEELVFRELVPWAERSNILRRKRKVTQNASLPPNELRTVNVKNVFEVTQNITGAVLLIDDVYTTGATWKEAARVLKEAGAERVYGFVFAKG